MTLLFLIFCTSAAAGPARRGTYTYTQPDGTTFRAMLSGDEFNKKLTTTDGCAICRDRDGWYCYAVTSGSGMTSSGFHVGSRNVPSQVLGDSRALASRPEPAASRRARAETGRIRAQRAPVLGPATKGESSVKGLVILAQTPDLKFNYGKSNFENMLSQKGYSFNGGKGCAQEYFADQGIPTSFTVSPVVTLSRNMSYYGRNDAEGRDENAHLAVAEACRLADQYVNFADFDNDGDGEVDNVFVFVAGPDEAEGASEDHIWSHQWYLLDGAGMRLSLDGKRINAYAISTELSHIGSGYAFTTIGTFCHEFSHILGLTDMYDTDYEDSGGWADALWRSTCLMDSGNYNDDGNTPPSYNAIAYDELGRGTCEVISSPGEYQLEPISGLKHRYFRINTDKAGEYFLLECRNTGGWDRYVGGSGLLIYHIDKSSRTAGYSDTYEMTMTASDRWYYNEVNCRPDRQCADLIEANPRATGVTDVFWPYGSSSAFTPHTNPAFIFHSGKVPDIAITNIRKSGVGVSFTITGPLSINDPEVFQDAAIISWETNAVSEDAACTISLGDSQGSTRVLPYAPGKYSYTFEGLEAGRDYTASVTAEINGERHVIRQEFTTKKFPTYSDCHAYIYLASTERYANGAFQRGARTPLRVYNAKGARRVKWYLNDTPISTDGSGYYTLETAGTLKAVVTYEDGSSDIIVKQINFR